ncbi:MAG: rhodanese-like domain-containing protein [Candidatus Cloacimonetes bacterium]|nr:rhodanese-like domain-containing protein [Candidatus Cloacimonadota bacterium]
MKKGILILLIALISVMMMVSCSKDDNNENDFEVLLNYMNSHNMTIDELLTGWIVAPDSTLYENIGDYYVMDLRSGDYLPANGTPDYEDGHIEGAVLTSSATIIADAANADGKPIIVVCWSGQSAGFNTMALRLSGYDAKVLKYGMSGWHSDFDMWSANIGTIETDNWVAAPGAIAEDMTYEMPDLVTNGDTGEEILAERVAAMLAGGFKGVKAINNGAGVLEAPENFFINNYWAAADVETYGNIVGSHRIKPLDLTKLDPDKQIVTYCWTSMTSSVVSAYLIVLGYDAASLRYGVNGMIYDNLAESKQWHGSADLPYVTE